MAKFNVDDHIASVLEPIEFVLSGKTYRVPNDLTEDKLAGLLKSEQAEPDAMQTHELSDLICAVLNPVSGEPVVTPAEFRDVPRINLLLTWAWLSNEIMSQMVTVSESVKKRPEKSPLSRKRSPASSGTKT